MPSKTYYLDNDPAKPLVTNWGFGFKNFSILYQGKPVGTIASSKELRTGHEFSLRGGRTLTVKLTGFFQPSVELATEGIPVPGSSKDPLEILKQLYYLALFLGGLSIAMGLAAEFFEVSVLRALGMDYFTSVVGLLIIMLGYAVKQRIMTAVICLIALQALDIAMMTFISLQSNGSAPTAGILFKVYIISYFIKGIGAIKNLNKNKKAYA
jgi:hypothetical protein